MQMLFLSHGSDGCVTHQFNTEAELLEYLSSYKVAHGEPDDPENPDTWTAGWCEMQDGDKPADVIH